MTDSTHPKPTVTSSGEQELEQRTAQVLQLALAKYQTGHVKEAEDLYRAILEILPSQADANHQMGVMAVKAGQAAEGLSYLEMALKSRPEREAYWFSYVDALLQTGQVETARQILELGQLHGLQGEAVEYLSAQLTPSHSPVTKKITQRSVTRSSASGKKKQAPIQKKGQKLGVLEQAFHPKLGGAPSNSEINKVVSLYGQARIIEAQELARSLTVRFPQHGFGWKVLGAVLQEQSRFEDAVLCMKEAVRLMPEDIEALCNLGATLLSQSQFIEAETILNRALALNPEHPEALATLGGALLKQGRFLESEIRLNHALALKPNSSVACVNLGTTLLSQSRIPEAIKAYQCALEIRPIPATAHSNLLFCQSHDVGVGSKQLFAAHLAFGEQFEAPLRSGWRAHKNIKDAARCLQVGFVSGDLYNHAVASFLEPVLVYLAKKRDLSLHAYYTHTIEDTTTERLRTYFSQWNAAAALSDAQLAEKIRADGIDILFDLSGHTNNNRLLTFARKPAPVQVSWMGYPSTTGLKSMDYYICDKFFVPPGELDWQFTEKMVYLPTSSVFQPDASAPEVNRLPALDNGYITFGSFNRDNKINDGVIELFAKVLKSNPSSCLIMAGINLENQPGFVERFALAGILADRLTFYPRTNMHDYLKLHHLVDVCLDTFPYGGGTTTFHAACMGVPTVTLAGKTAASRSGASILGRLGLVDLVATSVENFIEISTKLSTEVNELALTRESMRTRLNDSGVGKPELLCTHIGVVLRTAWERWCAGTPPETISITP
jgi:predicted O-linked N-acetylglucosamine transferase (SPINDLY family)